MELLSLMEKHERLMADLYERFAQLLPKHKEFWLELAQQEVMHSLWVRNFSDKVSEERVAVEPTSVTVSSLQTSIESLNAVLDSLDDREIDMVYAISVAVNYENALIERYAMDQYQSISPLFEKLLEDLRTSCEKHRDVVNRTYKGLKK